MANHEPIGRRLGRVATVVLIGGLSYAVGTQMSGAPTQTAFFAGVAIMLAITLGLIPVIFTMLRLERQNWQFSLRSLFITTTLLALTLGAIAYALRL
jgi:hypothetical protein